MNIDMDRMQIQLAIGKICYLNLIEFVKTEIVTYYNPRRTELKMYLKIKRLNKSDEDIEYVMRQLKVLNSILFSIQNDNLSDVIIKYKVW